jgi:hypothetical protein
MCGVGGLTTFNNYWSSSQNNANNAWDQNVGNGGGPGNQNTDNKNNTNHVRPVRGFHHDKRYAGMGGPRR